MTDSQKISELLATRLCHDLTGPIGAVNNGVEFMEEDPSMHEHAMELINQSAKEAIARLQFFRQAYGRINHSGEVSLTERKQLVEDFLAHSKLELDWPDSNTDASGIGVSYKMARMMLNMIIIMASLMIRGGTVSIRVIEDGKQKSLSLVGKAERIKEDIDLERALAQEMPVDELTPKLVQPYLTGELAKEIGATLSLNYTEGELNFTASKPIDEAQ